MWQRKRERKGDYRWSQCPLGLGDSSGLEAGLAPLSNLYCDPAVVLSMPSYLIVNVHVCVLSPKDHTLSLMPDVCGISLKAWLIWTVQSCWFPHHPRKNKSKARETCHMCKQVAAYSEKGPSKNFSVQTCDTGTLSFCFIELPCEISSWCNSREPFWQFNCEKR